MTTEVNPRHATLWYANRYIFDKYLLMILGLMAVVYILMYFMSTTLAYIDIYPHQWNYRYFTWISDGQIPYLDFEMEYPPLFFVPVIIAAFVSTIMGSFNWYVWSFQVFMIACWFATALVVYVIANALYGRARAIVAGIVFACSFASAYFTLTTYDPFPTLIMMLAIGYGLIRGKEDVGIGLGIIGFFAKLFPAAAIPFILIRGGRAAVTVAVAMVATVLIVIGGAILVMGTMPMYRYGGTGIVQSLPYTLQQALWGVTGHLIGTLWFQVLIGIPIAAITIYVLLRRRGALQTSPTYYLTTLTVAIVAVLALSTFHSPQYAIWFTPLCAILASRDVKGILVFAASQIMLYIQYPLGFWKLYVNDGYVADPLTIGWWGAVVFFIAYWGIIFLLMGILARNAEKEVSV